MDIINNIGITNIAIGIVGISLVLVLLVQKLRAKKQAVTLPENDEPVQTKEIQSFKKNNEEKNLTLEEKLELSWQFLFNITEIVMNKFSKDDRNQVETIGKELDSRGMKYEHVISLGIKVDVNKAQNLDLDKDKQQSQSR